MKQEVARFSIQKTQYIDPGGKVAEDFPEFYTTKDGLETLTEWYRMMVLARLFDAKAINLQKQGRMGTYASCEGQEAIGVGVASAMEPDDVLVPTYRDQAARMVRAERAEDAMASVMLAWGGDERGYMPTDRKKCDLPMFIPIATQTGVAVGIAMQMVIRKKKQVVVCMLGDGATSKGDTHEAMNWAGVWRLPVVFVIENNQYAISQPRRFQSGAETLAQLGIGAGIRWCKQVDGNDVVAVYDIMCEALRRARSGQGPSVIEAITYRLGNHTTADDAGRYRTNDEVEKARAEEPLIRMRAFLEERQMWGEHSEATLREACEKRVERAVKEYERQLTEDPRTTDDMFAHLFETLPAGLAWQRDMAREFVKIKKEERHGA